MSFLSVRPIQTVLKSAIVKPKNAVGDIIFMMRLVIYVVKLSVEHKHTL